MDTLVLSAERPKKVLLTLRGTQTASGASSFKLGGGMRAGGRILTLKFFKSHGKSIVSAPLQWDTLVLNTSLYEKRKKNPLENHPKNVLKPSETSVKPEATLASAFSLPLDTPLP